MTLADRIRKEPMNWKDWITALGILLTLSAVLLKGGQMVEQLSTANRQLIELSTQLQALRNDHSGTQRDITELRGTDRLHDEQIRALQTQLQGAKR